MQAALRPRHETYSDPTARHALRGQSDAKMNFGNVSELNRAFRDGLVDAEDFNRTASEMRAKQEGQRFMNRAEQLGKHAT